MPLLHARTLRSTTSSSATADGSRFRYWPTVVMTADAGDSTTISGTDELVTAISADGSISAKAIVTTELIAETSRLQGLGGLAAAALGRALTCCILVADGVEPEETFQVNFRGDGPLRGVLALSNGRLEARGYVGNPAVKLPPNAMGKFDVGAGVGKGTLQVVRTKNLPGEEVATPYTSMTEIKSGESECSARSEHSARSTAHLGHSKRTQQRRRSLLTINLARPVPPPPVPPSLHRAPAVPEDINWYLAESEQREGALAAGVFVEGIDDGVDRNDDCLNAAKVCAAGGWYVQLLPFASDETVEQLQTNLANMANRSPTSMIRDGMSAEDVIKLLLDGMDPQIMTRKRPPPLSESCPCCDERVFRTLRLLPKSEVDDIMEKNEVIDIKCEFCGKRYQMTPEEIKADREKNQMAA